MRWPMTSNRYVVSSILLPYLGAEISNGTSFTSTGTDVINSVPDGGVTALLLGAALTGIGLIRRKLS